MYDTLSWLCSATLYCIIIAGKHMSYRHLDYEPRGNSAITSIGGNHVMVAQCTPLAVCIHHLPGGEIVRRIGYQELGLRQYHNLWGVNFNGLLHLAVGKDCDLSLHTYKVSTAFQLLAHVNSTAKYIWRLLAMNGYFTIS